MALILVAFLACLACTVTATPESQSTAAVALPTATSMPTRESTAEAHLPATRSAFRATTALPTHTSVPAATSLPVTAPPLPVPTYILAPTPTPTTPISTPTANATPTFPSTTDATELAAICSFDEPQRRLFCRAEGQIDGQLKWTTNISSGYGGMDNFELTLKWGQFVDEIEVHLEECIRLKCSLSTTTIEVELESRGDCPDDFTGWFTTFLIDDISLVTQVGQPGQIRSNDYKPHG